MSDEISLSIKVNDTEVRMATEHLGYIVWQVNVNGRLEQWYSQPFIAHQDGRVEFAKPTAQREETTTR